MQTTTKERTAAIPEWTQAGSCTYQTYVTDELLLTLYFWDDSSKEKRIDSHRPFAQLCHVPVHARSRSLFNQSFESDSLSQAKRHALLITQRYISDQLLFWTRAKHAMYVNPKERNASC